MAFIGRQPLGRAGHVCVAYKDCILLFGGYRENGPGRSNIYYPSEELWFFCPLTEAWDLKTCQLDSNSGPPSMSGPSAAVIWDYMYLFGGYTQALEGSLNHLYRLSLEHYTWEKLDPKGQLPLAVDKGCAWSYSGKLYIFGGFGSPTSISYNTSNPTFQFVFDSVLWRGWTNQFYEYDPEDNTWRIPKFQGELPHARAAHSVTVLNDKVFIFGGRHDKRRTNDLHCLDMTTMQWSGKLPVVGPEPQGRSWHSLTAVSDSKLILYGGFSKRHEALGECWLFDIPSLKWQRMNLPFDKPRIWHSACRTIYNEVAIFGGSSSSMVDLDIRPEQSSEMIIIGISPKSLFRICLDRVGMLPQLSIVLRSLPYHIQNILRIQMYATRTNSFDDGS